MAVSKRRAERHYGFGVSLIHRGERGIELIGCTGGHKLQCDPQLLRRSRYRRHRDLVLLVCWIPEDRDPPGAGHGFRQYFESLGAKLRAKSRNAGYVPAWSRKACDDSFGDRVGTRAEYGWASTACLPQRRNISRVRSHDKIEIEPHQLRGLRGCELVHLTARPAVFDHDVLAFYVAKLAQRLPERLDGRQGGGTNVGS